MLETISQPLNNLGVLAIVVLLYSVIIRRTAEGHLRTLLLGTLFPVAVVAVMLVAYEPLDGVLFDARHAILGLAAPFGGTLAAIATAAIATTGRIWIGGAGALAGVISIIIAAGAGIIFELIIKNKYQRISITQFLNLSAMVSLSSLSIFLIPVESGQELALFMMLAPQMIFMIFTGILFMGMFLQREYSRTSEEDKWAHQATIDPLTNLKNRRGFDLATRDHMNFLRKEGLPFSLLAVDCDHFKDINDKYGHKIGDQVLVELAAFMKKILRKEDILARFGGDEFLVFLPRCNHKEAINFAERLRQEVKAKPFHGPEECFKITLSIGVVEMLASNQDISELAHAADLELYKAKTNGRDQVAPALDPVVILQQPRQIRLS